MSDDNEFRNLRLALETLRQQGVPFSHAWPLASRRAGIQVSYPLASTRAAWMRAYNNEPASRAEAAAAKALYINR
jgi:hypothetical protein